MGCASYEWVKHLYIDDPISSLDDNNAIAIACDLGGTPPQSRVSPRRQRRAGPAPTSCSHLTTRLFFNVMCNEIGRTREGQEKVSTKRYFLHRPDAEGCFTLRATGDTPYFHHVATLAELQQMR